MALISISEYAELNGVGSSAVRRKALRGNFKTARKIGNGWVIDSDEPYSDKRQVALNGATIDLVVRTYNSTGSIKETARVAKISEQKARKVLITKGVYETPLSRKINDLWSDGLTSDEIEQKMNLSKATVNSYLPYEKGIYKEEKTMEELVQKELDFLKEDSPELADVLLDWYYEPETKTVRYEEAGMDYQGEDKNAERVCQSENGKII